MTDSSDKMQASKPAWPNGPTPWGTASDVSAYLNVSTATLCRMRASGMGPAWAALTDHAPRYHIQDVDAWLDSRKAVSK